MAKAALPENMLHEHDRIGVAILGREAPVVMSPVTSMNAEKTGSSLADNVLFLLTEEPTGGIALSICLFHR